MYKRVIIIPYKLGSQSAKYLKQEISKRVDVPVLLVSKQSKTYQPRWTDYRINWGCSSDWDFVTQEDIWMYKEANRYCVDKLKFFQEVSKNPNINIPEWTTDAEIAKTWKDTVVCRSILTGHSGSGIILYDNNAGDTEIPKVPLYVKYKKKRHEYRVHVFNGEVIDVTQKRKRKGFENPDTKVRNHKNGWVYCRENIQEPHDLREQALLAVEAIGLHFGAVDIIWNEKENKSYVLEINSAPGLVETTLNKYVESFVKEINNAI